MIAKPKRATQSELAQISSRCAMHKCWYAPALSTPYLTKEKENAGLAMRVPVAGWLDIHCGGGPALPRSSSPIT